MGWVAVPGADALEDDEIVGAEIGGRKIAVCRSQGRLYAFDNVCTHQFALLSDGFVEDGVIECPLHQGRFDCATGRALCAPLTQAIAVYPVREDGGSVQVEVA
jgi:3-phenylpropionate/trans-cinnamate dioxygenase ferredoxin subunit